MGDVKSMSSQLDGSHYTCFDDFVVNKNIDGLCELIRFSDYDFLSSCCKKAKEYQYLSAAYLKLGLYEQCLGLLKKGCRRHPNCLPLMNLQAICHSRSGDFDSEIFFLENIVRLQSQRYSSIDNKYLVRLELARKKIFDKENREIIYFNQDNCLRYVKGDGLGKVLFITFWGSRGEGKDKFGDDFFYLREGYAEKFIIQNGWDVLAVNKKKI